VHPHPDDEAFGCGGLIAAKRAAGVRVHVVFLTAGEASHAGCCGVAKEAVAENRRILAAKAGRHLGLEPSATHWLGLADGHIPRAPAGEAPGETASAFDEAVSKLADVLAELAPAEVYCPHPLDGWADHVAAGEITRAAVAAVELRVTASASQAKPIELWHYIVWAWLNLPLKGILRLGWRNAVRLDIGGVFDQKQAAIQAYLQETAPCGKPWSGVLPRDFLRAFDWPHEVFFRADLGQAMPTFGTPR
jgi:LmbE family N-acetylglucosaminyl deacetylase